MCLPVLPIDLSIHPFVYPFVCPSVYPHAHTYTIIYTYAHYIYIYTHRFFWRHCTRVCVYLLPLAMLSLWTDHFEPWPVADQTGNYRELLDLGLEFSPNPMGKQGWMRGQFVWKSVAELPRLGSAWVSMEECGTSMSTMYGCYHLLYIYIYIFVFHALWITEVWEVSNMSKKRSKGRPLKKWSRGSL